MSRFGHWAERDGLPVFAYTADQRLEPAAAWDPITAPVTTRHWAMIGNRRIGVQVANDATSAVWDAADGHRWLTAPDPAGTGVSVMELADGPVFGTASVDWPPGVVPVREFGPTWFRVRFRHAGLALERTLHCPEGEAPYVLIHVRLRAVEGGPGRLRKAVHRERWALRPRFVMLGTSVEGRRHAAAMTVDYDIDVTTGRLAARERRVDTGTSLAGTDLDRVAAGAAVFGGTATGRPPPAELPRVFGAPRTVVLADLTGDTWPEWTAIPPTGGAHPVLELVSEVTLEPGQARDLWFRFGLDPAGRPDDPSPALRVAADRATLRRRLPAAHSRHLPEAAREITWHAAMLTGGACRDEVLGGHTLDQGSTYAYEIGMNAAARDPLQHALPLVYSEPDLALSVLRNTCAWASPDGCLPYALDGAKQPWTTIFTPSDQNLYALMLASEYLAATGDLAAFDVPLRYHPAHGARAVPLRTHLLRQQEYFAERIGRGERGHVRMLNADWNDAAVIESGVERTLMIEKGESVLNSAFASWVLARWAAACDRLGQPAAAGDARRAADQLRAAVASAWNGRWFHRAYAPGADPVGEDECWLEPQPWALLCGAATPDQADQLLRTIDREARTGSPLGARVRFPVPPDYRPHPSGPGQNRFSVWFAVNATLVWAAAALDPDLARDEWRRMTLRAHTDAYPEIWEGTISGPDSYNGPESRRPGRTWAIAGAGADIAMQGHPVANLHSHAQPLLAYLRLLGVEPRPDGGLSVTGPAATGCSFASATFAVDGTGHGRLTAAGPVEVYGAYGLAATDGPGQVRW